VKALRYYERVGLVRPSRASNGYRVYTGADVRAVVEVRALMALGLSAREAEPFVACLRAPTRNSCRCPSNLRILRAPALPHPLLHGVLHPGWACANAPGGRP